MPRNESADTPTLAPAGSPPTAAPLAATTSKARVDILSMPALLTMDELLRLESDGPASREGGPARWLALSVLTKTGAQLLDMAREPKARPGLEGLARCLPGYCQNLARLAELLEIASARVSLALCEPVAA